MRWWSNRKTPFEIIYAGVFALFGITDLFELFDLTVWLWLVKALVLAALFSLIVDELRKFII